MTGLKTIRIKDKEIQIHPVSKKRLDLEMAGLTLIVYLVIILYAIDWINWPVFYLLFHFFYMRFFMGNHERFHSDHTRRWNRTFERLTEYLAVVVTPWDEPYDSIKRKHFTHHLTHLPGKDPRHDILEDPHSIYESGGPWRSLLSCLIYEEAQLVIDIKTGQLSRSRWIRTLFYLPLQILFIMNFGWEKYLGVFLAVRVMSASGWFFFSWFSHTYYYRFGSRREIPRIILVMLEVINGKRVGRGFFRHTTHHAWPFVPSNELHKLDEAVLEDPASMPRLVPT